MNTRAIAPPSTIRSTGASESILVVEDEPGVCRLIETMLTRLGYVVMTANTPADAIAKVADHNTTIDLLLTDVMLPDLSGASLSRELSKSRPGLKVLFMSGFGDDVIDERDLAAKGTAFIQKPFTAIDLAEKVGQLLEQPVGVRDTQHRETRNGSHKT